MTTAEAPMTTAEMAAHLRCSEYLVKKLAREKRIGLKLPGRAGWRFEMADIALLKVALAPAPPVERRRRRRAS